MTLKYRLETLKEMATFDRRHTSSYLSFIITMYLSSTVAEIFSGTDYQPPRDGICLGRVVLMYYHAAFSGNITEEKRFHWFANKTMCTQLHTLNRCCSGGGREGAGGAYAPGRRGGGAVRA